MEETDWANKHGNTNPSVLKNPPTGPSAYKDTISPKWRNLAGPLISAIVQVTQTQQITSLQTVMNNKIVLTVVQVSVSLPSLAYSHICVIMSLPSNKLQLLHWINNVYFFFIFFLNFYHDNQNPPSNLIKKSPQKKWACTGNQKWHKLQRVGMGL